MPRPTRRNTTAFLNGHEWWLSKTSKDGSQRYPERIRVGGRDNPRMYYPVDRDALLALAGDLETYCLPISGIAVAEHIREAIGVDDAEA